MNRRFKISTLIKVTVPAILIVLLIILRFNVFSESEFSPARYVVVEVNGVDSRGRAEAYLDEESLYNALADNEDYETAKLKYGEFVDTINISVSKNEELSNGDVITIRTDYDETVAEKLGITVDYSERSITVSGLKKGEELDLFSDVKIITGGTSPYVYATYINESENEYLASLEYKIDKTSDLSIGDEITITCLIDETAAADNGYYYDVSEMKYTIAQADKYIDSPDEIDMSAIEALTKDNIQTITDETADTTYHMAYKVTGDSGYLYRDNNEAAVSFELDRVTLANNTTGFEQKYENYILVFYKGYIALPKYTTEEDPYDYVEAYFCFMYSDAILTMNGEFAMAAGTNSRFVCGSSYESAVKAVEEEIGNGYAVQNLE